MSDVWKVIEIVKEQAWLNDLVQSFEWTTQPESVAVEREGSALGVSDDEELAALLQGTYIYLVCCAS